MDQTTTSTQADDGSTGTADKPGTAHRTRRRAFLAMGAAAILAAGAGAGAFASRSGPNVSPLQGSSTSPQSITWLF